MKKERCKCDVKYARFDGKKVFTCLKCKNIWFQGTNKNLTKKRLK